MSRISYSILCIFILLNAWMGNGLEISETRLRAYACSPDNQMCIFVSQTSPPSDKIAVILEGPPTAKWSAVSFGVTTMTPCDTFIGYVDVQNKNPTVSKRTITGFSSPAAVPADKQNAVPNTNVFGLAAATNKFVVQFTIPQSPEIKLQQPMDVMWGLGTSAPEVTGPNQFNAVVSKHTAAGSLKLNLSDPAMQQAFDSALKKTGDAFELFRKSGPPPKASAGDPTLAGAERGAGAVVDPNGTAAASFAVPGVLLSQYLVGCLPMTYIVLTFISI